MDELTHPEPGYHAIGMKSYGRAPTFLLAAGYEQARSVIAALAGDWTAARDVQLDLPETGVCSLTLAVRAITDGAAIAVVPAGDRRHTLRPGLITVALDGIEPCQIVVATRAADTNPLVTEFVRTAKDLLVGPITTVTTPPAP